MLCELKAYLYPQNEPFGDKNIKVEGEYESMVSPLPMPQTPWEKFMEESGYSPQTIKYYRIYAAMMPEPMTTQSKAHVPANSVMTC